MMHIHQLENSNTICFTSLHPITPSLINCWHNEFGVTWKHGIEQNPFTFRHRFRCQIVSIIQICIMRGFKTRTFKQVLSKNTFLYYSYIHSVTITSHNVTWPISASRAAGSRRNVHWDLVLSIYSHFNKSLGFLVTASSVKSFILLSRSGSNYLDQYHVHRFLVIGRFLPENHRSQSLLSNNDVATQGRRWLGAN